ncbi:MAG: hypothetical protein ABI224_00715 [Acetobacteraceae bacterium]
MCASGDAVQAGGSQHRAKLAAARERRLEARAAVVLAAGHIGILRHQRPALCGYEGPHAGLLRLQSQAAMTLFGGRNPIEADGVTRAAAAAVPHQPASTMR